jgi:hypothetical protein
MILLVLSLIMALVIFGLSVINKQVHQSLPTITWSSLAVTPLIYNWIYFEDNVRSVQAIGVFLIGLALQAGDFYAIRNKQRSLSINELSTKVIFNKYVKFLVLITLIIPFSHYLLSNSIPIIKFINNFSPAEVASARESYTKLNVPFGFRYIPNIYINILAPLTFSLLILLKKYLIAAIVLLNAIIYATSSAAKAPTIILLGMFLFSVLLMQKYWYKKLVFAAIISFQILVVFCGILYGNLLLDKSSECPVPINVNATPSNISRSCPKGEVISINRIVDSLGYRLFLAPTEVSNNWYRYYGFEEKSDRSLQSLINRDPDQQASNKVGIWAYKDNWPDAYLDSVNAYASIDADSYSFYGLASVLGSALILFFIRAFLTWSQALNNPLEYILQGLALFQIILFPFTASIQAILFSNFLMIILFLLSIMRRDQIRFKLQRE